MNRQSAATCSVIGRALYFEDIAHYQKIIVTLLETDRLMKEVDGVM